jgi:dynein intermediate chain 1
MKMLNKGKKSEKGKSVKVKTDDKTSQEKPKPNLQNPSVRRVSQSYLGSRTQLDSKGRLHVPSRGPLRRGRDDDFKEDDNNDEWMTAPQLVKPENQLELTEQELKEEFTRILTANNPHAPTNIVRFNHKDQMFKPIASIDQLAIHFVLESNLLHKESDEGQRQLAKQEGMVSDEEEEEGDENEENATEEEKEDETQNKTKKKLRNQFNFSDRASQTYNNPLRERNTMTEPPPRVNYSAIVNQMEIFDAYLDDLAKQEKAKEKKSTKGSGRDEAMPKKSTGLEVQNDDIGRIARAALVMERMVNQNSFDEIAQDFKYYDDPADEYKDGKGSLLPLWRFKYDKAHKMSVTAICWNLQYQDLFAVGHGSYDFSTQKEGLICFYSLKNPSFPEYIYTVHSGVMCLDIHPQHSSLAVAGLYDGSVVVFNLQEKQKLPVFRSTAKTGKHSDPVWQVLWQKNNLDGNLNFMSASSDGRIVTWTIVKNELQYEDTIVLYTPETVIAGNEGMQSQAISSATCLCVSPHADHLYLVGTEEGKIFKCSKVYKDQYLDVLEGHHMAVHRLCWNPFHANVFASCGADWTVKIWDHDKKEPMFSYDLNSIVGDVTWSPYSSTVLAAVTTEGKVYVYDMSISKYEPLCIQSVSQKKPPQLTHVTFNPSYPIIIVGDNKGTVLSLKLSPNVRKALKEKNRTPETEQAKMAKLISFVNEPLLTKDSQ